MPDLRAMLGDRYDDVIIKATKRALLNYPNLPISIEQHEALAGQALHAVLPDLLAQAWNQGRWAEQRYQEPCLLHDITGEDVPGWEMAACTCEDLTNPYRKEADRG